MFGKEKMNGENPDDRLPEVYWLPIVRAGLFRDA